MSTKRARLATSSSRALTVGFFLVFSIVGTFLFVRADRNR
jgi:hypothetical protein